MSTPFIQLTGQEVKYLLDLITEIDNDTIYTARQRAYTVPKLMEIYNGTFERKLMYQDVDYLLELIEDDEVPSQIKEHTRETLQVIKALQVERLGERSNIDTERARRRSLRHGK